MNEQFSEPEPNVIESTAGFSLRVLGRTGMRYVEGNRSAFIDSEVLARPNAIALFKDSIKTWEGDDAQPVSAADRERIVDNTKRAFEACGYDLEVHADYDWR
jgi:hypothetical protein